MQVVGFFIFLFFITAGTCTFIFLLAFIPFWLSMAVLNCFNPKLTEKISNWMLDF